MRIFKEFTVLVDYFHTLPKIQPMCSGNSSRVVLVLAVLHPTIISLNLLLRKLDFSSRLPGGILNIDRAHKNIANLCSKHYK